MFYWSCLRLLFIGTGRMNDVYTLCKRGPFSSLLTNGRWLFQIIPIYRKALFCFSTSTGIQGVWLYPFWATYKDLVICASSIFIKLSNQCKPRILYTGKHSPICFLKFALFALVAMQWANLRLGEIIKMSEKLY